MLGLPFLSMLCHSSFPFRLQGLVVSQGKPHCRYFATYASLLPGFVLRPPNPNSFRALGDLLKESEVPQASLIQARGNRLTLSMSFGATYTGVATENGTDLGVVAAFKPSFAERAGDFAKPFTNGFGGLPAEPSRLSPGIFVAMTWKFFGPGRKSLPRVASLDAPESSPELAVCFDVTWLLYGWKGAAVAAVIGIPENRLEGSLSELPDLGAPEPVEKTALVPLTAFVAARVVVPFFRL